MRFPAKRDCALILCGMQELTYNRRCEILDVVCRPDFAKNEPFLIKTLGEGVYNRVKDKFSDGDAAEKIARDLQKRGMFAVTLYDELYPERLKEIPNPPHVLYCKGDKSLLKERKFAIVGSRRTGAPALALAGKISRGVSQAFAVVTGNADGADSAAAEGAMESGRLICVLASGIDKVYPAASADLVKRACAHGLVISEYCPGVEAKPYHFPVRNRIIAGLCEGGLIVSAGERSGALITAGLLEEYSGKVFALPYFPSSPAGAGCNKLIKYGAALCESAEDILSSFGIKAEGEGKAEMSAEERELYLAVKQTDGVLLSEVAEKLGKPAFKLIPLVSSLEIKGLIVKLGGNRYSAL